MKLTPFGLFLLFGITLTLSCSSVNRPSREHYYEKKRMRHGLVPLSQAKSKLDLRAAKRGEQLFEKHCTECHGAQGRGDGPKALEFENKPADLTQLTKTVPFFDFYLSLSRAEQRMPGWNNPLTAKELKDLTHYIRTLGDE